MPAFVFKDAEVIIAGVDLSDHVRSLTFNYSGELQDATSMGDNSRVRLSGLTDWSFDVTFKQDFDSGSVDATLFSLVGGAAIAMSVKPVKAVATGATNPKYNGNVVIENYPPLAGNIGDLAEIAASFASSGDLTRSVA